MKKLRRRLGSALLIVAMLLSMFPSSAFAAWWDDYRYYYFYNSTDTSLGDDVKVYYSTDGKNLEEIAHDSRIAVQNVNAIVFYVYINQDKATDAGVTFTTDNQQGILNNILKDGQQAVISGDQGNTIGRTNFNQSTNAAYEKGCTYAFFYSQFNWNQHGGQNRFRGFQVWLKLPTEQYSIAYHTNIPNTADTTQYQTLNTTAGDTKLWTDIFARDGYTLKEWNTKPDGTGQAFELGKLVNKDSFSDWSGPTTSGSVNIYTTDLYAIWEKEAEAGTLNIQVYVDGQPMSFTSEKDLQKYISAIDATGQTVEGIDLTYSNQTIQCKYNFTTYDAADLLLTVADGYVLQGIEGAFIYGASGWNGITSQNEQYTIDNVDGGSTLKIYLNTKYTVTYDVPEDGAPVVDDSVYVITKALDESIEMPDFEDINVDSPQEDRTEGHTGGWTNKELKDTVTLESVPDNFTGWYTNNAGQETHALSYTGDTIKQAAEKSGDNTPTVIECYARKAQHTITISYEDENGEILQAAYTDMQNAGTPYSFDVSADESGNIPFTIDKEGTQYVFDHFKDGSDSLSGTLNADVEITAVYLLDSDKDGTPNEYEANVTYRVENGTWSDGTNTDKTEKFTLKTFDEESNTWVEESPAPTLGETIPSGMKPVENYLADDADWDSEISPATLVVNGAVYTYKFTKAKAPALTVEKTVVSIGNQDVTDQQDIPDAQVGDAIVYQIEVTNTGNVKLEGVNVTDTMKISGAEGSLIDSNKNVTLYSDETCQTEFTGVFDLNKGESKTLYAKYEVVQDDAGKQLKNSAAAISGTTDDTDDAPPVNVDAMYALNYDGNAQQGGTVAGTPGSTSHHAGDVDLSGNKPTHSDVNDTKVVFIGWSLTQTNQIYAAGENYGTIVDQVTFADKDITVYAVWGYDTNDDGTADATQVMIQPAAMTIYTGGEGYLGTVDAANGTTVGAEESGLPEPGFYFTLPYDMDQSIKNAAGTSGNAADLSQYLTINAQADSDTGTTEARSWTIQLYDPDGTSDVNGKYVYSFTSGEGQDPVRMQFTNGEEIIISDKFDVNEALHQEYTMSLYTGSVSANTVQAVVKIDGQEDQTATVGLWDSTLTIRGVTDEGTSTGIVENVSDTVNTVTASTEGGTPTYYINGSQIQVTNQDAVKLLVDSIVDNGNNVHDTLLEMAKDELPSSYDGAEFKYLDLVDSSNGNVWVTMGANDSLTVYWPYPEGTNKNDEFTIVHYKGLDRDFDLNDFEDQQVDVEILSTENGKLECTDQGIKFNVSSFSPFALVYDKQSSGGGNTGGNTGGSDRPELERGDHYAYIVGYEDETVRPQNNITRAEVATIFFRLLTQESREAYFTTENSFSDVSADDWYSNTVSTLVNAGIIVGYEDGTFRPNAPITRAELAAIASRFDDLSGGTSDLTDISGHWAEDAINSAYNKGWVGGYPDGTFRPDQNITRAEVMSLVNRVLDREVDEDGMLEDMVTWIDNLPGAWYYEAVQEATNSHDYNREEGEVEDWTSINEAPDWPAIEADLLEMIGQ